jgi:hypothetical protein
MFNYASYTNISKMNTVAATPGADCKRKRGVEDPAPVAPGIPRLLNTFKEDSSESDDTQPAKRRKMNAHLDPPEIYPSRFTSRNSSEWGDSMFFNGPDVPKGDAPPKELDSALF